MAVSYFDIDEVLQLTDMSLDDLMDVASVLGFQVSGDRICNQARFLGGYVPESFCDYLLDLRLNAEQKGLTIVACARQMVGQYERGLEASRNPGFNFETFFLESYKVHPDRVDPSSLLHHVLQIYRKIILPLADRTAELAGQAFVEQTLSRLYGGEASSQGDSGFFSQARQAIADRLELAAQDLLPASLSNPTNSLQEAKSLPTLPEGRQNLEQV